MFNDLSDFYQSKEWRGLIDQIKIERVDDQGQVICEYCGKPITRAYDIIGHHREELTDENVHDYQISLNPDNVVLVHHRCHNYIHNKLGHKARQVFIVYGAPLSGKTSYVKENAEEGDLIIDIDSIWECVSGLDRYVKPKRLNAVVFAVRDNLLDSVRYRRGKWLTAYIIGGYPLASERERLSKELGAREVFIDTSMDECIRRLNEDPSRDHAEWIRYIEEWFRRYNGSL